MIYDRTNIQISELCPLQFTEPRSTNFYPAANEYCGKISGSSDLVVQVLISEDVYSADSMYIKILDTNGVEVDRATFNKTLLSSGYYYANATFTASQLRSIGKNFNGYFEIYYEKTVIINPLPPFEVDFVVTKLADSVWYIINPTFQNDLQEIEYTHEENDYNTIFKHGANTYKFKIWVEGGFIPKDERDEQEVEDFIQQDMVNETVYGDEYVVEPFTLGDNISGVPNWLRKKFSRISLLDSVKFKQMVNFGETNTNEQVEYKRVSGAKLEKIEDTKNGLATYKIDLQTLNNYLQ